MRFLFAFGVIEINDFHTGRANTQISEQCRVSFNKISIPTDNAVLPDSVDVVVS